MAFEITKMMTSVDETTTQDYVFVESEGDVKKISRDALLPFYTQAGHVAVSSGAAEITFATPFESTPRVVATYATGGSTTYNNYNEIVLTDISKNGFKIKLIGGYAGTFTIDWIAFAGSSIPAKLASLDVAAHATSLDPEDDATASVTASDINVYFEFGIPRGEKGDTGATGPQGPQGEPGAGGMEIAIMTNGAVDSVGCAKATTCYDETRTWLLREVSGSTYKDYYVVSSNKTSVSEHVDKYTFNLFSKENFGDPAYASSEFETILFTIERTETQPGVYTYSSSLHTKVWNAERTQMRRDSYNASETLPSYKYYSITGTLDAISKVTTFSRYYSQTLSVGSELITVTWHGDGQSSDKIPAAIIRMTKGTTHGEVKNYDVSYSWSDSNNAWTLVIQLDSGLDVSGLLEVWSDTAFYR